MAIRSLTPHVLSCPPGKTLLEGGTHSPLGEVLQAEKSKYRNNPRPTKECLFHFYEPLINQETTFGRSRMFFVCIQNQKKMFDPFALSSSFFFRSSVFRSKANAQSDGLKATIVANQTSPRFRAWLSCWLRTEMAHHLRRAQFSRNLACRLAV